VITETASTSPSRPEIPRVRQGCRHTASQCCARNSLAKVCAFVRGDKICVAPPMSWAKQYRALKILETTANGT
jgi:hypothetical protein